MIKQIEVPAEQAERFKCFMHDNKWAVVHQDAGQAHLVGWGYEITWQKVDQRVTLRYFDKQGMATALLEVSDSASADMSQWVASLDE